jgi:hypothetical protein
MQFWTTSSPDQVLQMAAQTLTNCGYTVAFGPGIVSGSRKGKPSKLIGCSLMFLVLVPGLIYFMVAGKQQTASLTAAAQDGYTLVTITGGGTMWDSLRKRIEYHAPAAE